LVAGESERLADTQPVLDHLGQNDRGHGEYEADPETASKIRDHVRVVGVRTVASMPCMAGVRGTGRPGWSGGLGHVVTTLMTTRMVRRARS
jgi:hypothetical protein